MTLLRHALIKKKKKRRKKPATTEGEARERIELCHNGIVVTCGERVVVTYCGDQAAPGLTPSFLPPSSYCCMSSLSLGFLSAPGLNPWPDNRAAKRTIKSALAPTCDRPVALFWGVGGGGGGAGEERVATSSSSSSRSSSTFRASRRARFCCQSLINRLRGVRGAF